MTIKEKRHILKLRFEEKYTLGSIGKIYGVSRQRIHQIITGYKSFSNHNFSFANIPDASTCLKCENNPAIYMHRIDGDPNNNKPTNFLPTCKDCHYLLVKERHKKK